MPTFRPAALFALKKARAAGQSIGIHCLIEVGTRESVLNMQEPTEKRPLLRMYIRTYILYTKISNFTLKQTIELFMQQV